MSARERRTRRKDRLCTLCIVCTGIGWSGRHMTRARGVWPAGEQGTGEDSRRDEEHEARLGPKDQREGPAGTAGRAQQTKARLSPDGHAQPVATSKGAGEGVLGAQRDSQRGRGVLL